MSCSYKKKKSSYGFYSATPLPTLEQLTEHYSDKYYEDPWNTTYQINYTQEEILHKKLRADLALFVIKKELLGVLAGKTFVEIGFGEGFALKAAQEKGMHISGVDFTDSGLKMMNPDLLKYVAIEDAYAHIDKLIAQNMQFDACVIQNVLEHVIDPIEMIERIRAILKPNGIVVINVPNDYSDLQMKALETGAIDREFWFGPVEHLHYFNTDNLPKFIEAHGLSVKDMYGDFPIDFFLMNDHSNYVMDKTKGKQAHTARVTLDLLMANKGIEAYHQFCQALSAVGVGRNVCVVAQKSGE